jgi:predicted glycosyltransferase
MRIAFHVFSVLGAGHLQRARAITDALPGHEVVWLGHRPAGASGELAPYPVTIAQDPPSDIEDVACRAAGRLLATWLEDCRPDVLITEHFPFGNRRLEDGLMPVLQAARRLDIPVVASVRDIIGKSRLAPTWAEAALATVNDWYSAILWHGDTALLPFDFPLATALKPPIHPTGYVRLGQGRSRQPQTRHWVASCGSGNRGGLAFSLTALAAQRRLADQGWRLTLLCGPQHSQQVQAGPNPLPPGTTLLPWCEDLPGLLASAAVSVSQCGYNTCMEAIDSGAPTIFIPHVEPRDDEQEVRAEAMARFHGYRTLSAADPALAERLADAIVSMEGVTPQPPAIDLDGATVSADLIRHVRA